MVTVVVVVWKMIVVVMGGGITDGGTSSGSDSPDMLMAVCFPPCAVALSGCQGTSVTADV